MRTTSPAPVYRSSRDTRNVPLWNPSSKELLNVEEDEAGRLAGFRARFGRTFDAGKDADVTAHTTEESDKLASDKKADVKPKPKKELTDAELFGEFDEDDANLLEMISQFGKQDKGSAAQIARKKQEYSQYLTHPAATIRNLELLQNEQFRKDVTRPDMVVRLSEGFSGVYVYQPPVIEPVIAVNGDAAAANQQITAPGNVDAAP